jgi:Xaa-Pro aminopeptidase
VSAPLDSPDGRVAALAAGLGELRCRALAVVAQTGGDPDLAAFLAAPANLGAALLVAPLGRAPRLAYLAAMERDEAAGTGLPLVTPEQLEVLRADDEAPEPAAHLAWLLGRALAASGVPPGRVALAGRAPAGELYGACAALAWQGWEWVPGNELVRLLRKRKTAAELAAMRRAAAAASAGLREVARILAAARTGGGGLLRLDGEPLTAGRLRAAAARVLAAHGAEQPRGNIVAAGAEAGVPHSTGSDERPLRAGEPLIVDLFPRGGGRGGGGVSGGSGGSGESGGPGGSGGSGGRGGPPMFADCTRTFCVGPPPPAVARAHAAVLAALAAARSLAVPGARGWDLQEVVCLGLEEAGYPTPLHHPGTTTGYVHNLGHGVGHELHELPVFRKAAGAEGVLAAGDVFTLEPGLYDPAQGLGVRLEDLCHLGPEGLEILTPLPYDLDPRRWTAPGAPPTPLT